MALSREPASDVPALMGVRLLIVEDTWHVAKAMKGRFLLSKFLPHSEIRCNPYGRLRQMTAPRCRKECELRKSDRRLLQLSQVLAQSRHRQR